MTEAFDFEGPVNAENLLAALETPGDPNNRLNRLKAWAMKNPSAQASPKPKPSKQGGISTRPPRRGEKTSESKPSADE